MAGRRGHKGRLVSAGPVFGHTADGLFVTEMSGPAVLTGGGFGLEASLVPALISFALTVPVLVLTRRHGIATHR